MRSNKFIAAGIGLILAAGAGLAHFSDEVHIRPAPAIDEVRPPARVPNVVTHDRPELDLGDAAGNAKDLMCDAYAVLSQESSGSYVPGQEQFVEDYARRAPAGLEDTYRETARLAYGRFDVTPGPDDVANAMIQSGCAAH
jgi:hypothetical protein